ncbi:MAG: hypothetical protein ACOC9W_06560 [Persicimonas sp.]
MLVLFFAAASLCGCFSRLTGNAGEFTFGYETDIQLENFNKPLAPGSRLDLVAFEGATDTEQMRVVSAESSDTSVLTVAATTTRHATIEAGEAGHAKITMTVEKSDGSTVEDSVFMNVAEPVELALGHTCADTEQAAYEADGRVVLPFEMTAADGRAVIGEAYRPVRVEPEGALDFVAKPTGRSALVFRAGPPADEVRVRSTVDNTSLALRLVQRADIDELLPAPSTTHARTVVGENTFVAVMPMAGVDPVCQSRALTKAESLTPEICHVSADLEGGSKDWNRSQMAKIEGRSFGMCRYKIILPEAASGDGLETTLSIPVGEFPDGEDDAVAGSQPDREHRESVPWYLAPLMALLTPALAAPFAWWLMRRRNRRPS